MPYASIYIPAIAKGGMANAEGEYEIKVPLGDIEIQFQSIGYKKQSIIQTISEAEHTLNVTMESMAVLIDEVVIDPSQEDPAYNIIRKSIAMADLYKKQIEAYQCSIYVRSFYNTDNIPWMVKKLADEEDLKEMETGNIEESITYYSFQRPNIVKEKIIAKKSGDQDTLKTGSSYINLNFYDLGGSTIINPLSRYALQVYKYEFQYSFFEGEQQVHKIKLIPRRKGDDLMSGTIYINDGLWNINKVDVVFNQLVAKIAYKQIYNEIEPLVWMPTNHKFRVEFGALGFKMHVEYLATLNDLNVKADSIVNDKIAKQLNIKEEVEEENVVVENEIVASKKEQKIDSEIEELIQKDKLTNKETYKLVRLMKKQERLEAEKREKDTSHTYELSTNYKLEYEDSAFVQSDSLWNTERIVPLSDEEKEIYQARDSIVKEERGDTVYNEKRGTLGNILWYSGSIQSKNKKFYYRPKGLLSQIDPNFNTVDGLLLWKDIFDIKWDNKKGKSAYLNTDLGYAEARQTFLGKFSTYYYYNGKNRSNIYLSAGRTSKDFNSYFPFNDFLNSISTLAFGDNYSKIFQEDYFSISHGTDIINGLYWGASFKYADRIQLRNKSDFNLFNNEGEYTPNLPPNEDVLWNPSIISDNISSVFSTSLSYTPQQYFRMFGNIKSVVPSKYPTFKLNYRQGIDGLLESQADFKSLSFSINQSLSYRLIDQIQYHFEVGKFLDRQSVFFADYKSFHVEPFYLMSSTNTNSFKLLDYYTGNTNKQYFEGHFSVENDHLFLKYLPIFRDTGLKEKIEVNNLITEGNKTYTEFGYSLKQIFLLFNAGVFVGFEGSDYQSIGFRISTDIN